MFYALHLYLTLSRCHIFSIFFPKCIWYVDLIYIVTGASEQNISREGSSSTAEDPESAEKVKLLKEKISSNCAAMPIVLKRMKDCIAKIEKLDSYNAANIHQGFKRKKTG